MFPTQVRKKLTVYDGTSRQSASSYADGSSAISKWLWFFTAGFLLVIGTFKRSR